MNNKTNIEEDIKICNLFTKSIRSDLEEEAEDNFEIAKAIENILADRERLLEEKEIQEDNYQILSESISVIAKELGLQEDATIDEIYTAIRILKSKRLNMFEQLECNERAKKYDNLIEKINIKNKEIEENISHYNDYKRLNILEKININILDAKRDILQEILDTEQEKK